MNYFFTSDLHLGHENIIHYCSRPFKDVEHMNSEIICRWNERVKQDDIVFHIGDFCFRNSKGGKKGEGTTTKAKEYESKLNGKIIFIKGNHDRNNSLKTITEKLTIGYGRKRINLVHNPIHVDPNYKINFVGHVHNRWAIKRIKTHFGFTDAINVGVDVWDFRPVKFEELMKRYHKWKREAYGRSSNKYKKRKK